MEYVQWNINIKKKISIFLVIKEVQIKAKRAYVLSLSIFLKGSI